MRGAFDARSQQLGGGLKCLCCISVTKGGLGIGDLLQAIDRASCIDTLPQIVSMELDPATGSFGAFVHEWSLRPYAIASV